MNTINRLFIQFVIRKLVFIPYLAIFSYLFGFDGWYWFFMVIPTIIIELWRRRVPKKEMGFLRRFSTCIYFGFVHGFCSGLIEIYMTWGYWLSIVLLLWPVLYLIEWGSEIRIKFTEDRQISMDVSNQEIKPSTVVQIFEEK